MLHAGAVFCLADRFPSSSSRMACDSAISGMGDYCRAAIDSAFSSFWLFLEGSSAEANDPRVMIDGAGSSPCPINCICCGFGRETGVVWNSICSRAGSLLSCFGSIRSLCPSCNCAIYDGVARLLVLLLRGLKTCDWLSPPVPIVNTLMIFFLSFSLFLDADNGKAMGLYWPSSIEPLCSSSLEW